MKYSSDEILVKAEEALKNEEFIEWVRKKLDELFGKKMEPDEVVGGLPNLERKKIIQDVIDGKIDLTKKSDGTARKSGDYIRHSKNQLKSKTILIFLIMDMIVY